MELPIAKKGLNHSADEPKNSGNEKHHEARPWLNKKEHNEASDQGANPKQE